MGAAIRQLFKDACGEAKKPSFAVTELGAHGKVSHPAVTALFAADSYATLSEQGAFNVDWLELHNGSFLDDANGLGPAYLGIQMVHRLAAPGDAILQVRVDGASLAAHAVKKSDGSVRVLLVNTNEAKAAAVHLSLDGRPATIHGPRFEYSPGDSEIVERMVSAPRAPLVVSVPAYAMTVIDVGTAE
jgi:hypothetical protein